MNHHRTSPKKIRAGLPEKINGETGGLGITALASDDLAQVGLQKDGEKGSPKKIVAGLAKKVDGETGSPKKKIDGETGAFNVFSSRKPKLPRKKNLGFPDKIEGKTISLKKTTDMFREVSTKKNDGSSKKIDCKTGSRKKKIAFDMFSLDYPRGVVLPQEEYIWTAGGRPDVLWDVTLPSKLVLEVGAWIEKVNMFLEKARLDSSMESQYLEGREAHEALVREFNNRQSDDNWIDQWKQLYERLTLPENAPTMTTGPNEPETSTSATRMINDEQEGLPENAPTMTTGPNEPETSTSATRMLNDEQEGLLP